MNLPNIIPSFLRRHPADEKKPTGERIIASAVLKNGQLWAAPLHGWIIPDVCKYNGGSFVTADEQGFLALTLDGTYRFVDRTAAFRIALEAKQLQKVDEALASNTPPPQLDSRSLWG